MTATSGRTCLCLFLALSLTAALWIGLQAWHSGIAAARAHTVTMQLQGGPETDRAVVLSDTEGDKATACAPRDLHCAMVKQGLALAWPDERSTHDGKTVMAPTAELQPKKD